MTSHRPYRASLSLEAAIHEIESHREKHFDPELIPCSACFAKKTIICLAEVNQPETGSLPFEEFTVFSSLSILSSGGGSLIL